MTAPNMVTVDLEQGSKEWHDYRKNKVGASEISYLFNINPFCKAEDQTMYLLGLKLGFNTIFQSAAMRAGNDNESRIVKAVEEKYGIVTQPLVAHKGNVSASFDGITLDHDIVVEVKYSAGTYNFVKEKGFAPPHYELQVQQQLLVSGAEKAIFAAMHPETGDVAFSEIFAKEELYGKIISAVDEFFELYKRDWKEEDFVGERDDLDWLQAVQEYKEALALEEAAKAAKDKAKKELLQLAGGVRSSGAGCTVYQVKGRESIDYKKIVLDNKIKVDDKYKKTGEATWGIRVAAD